MTADIVNLRLARKRKARAEAERVAQANRISHGQGKAGRRTAQAERTLAERRLEGHKLTGPKDREEP